MRALFYHRSQHYIFADDFARIFRENGFEMEHVHSQEELGQVIEQIRKYNPDLILSMRSAPELSSELKGSNTLLIHYEFDKISRSDFFDRQVFGDNDLMLCAYKNDVEKFKANGISNAYYLPFFPNARPPARRDRNYRYDVSFVGDMLYDNDFRWYLREYGEVASARPDIKRVFEAVIVNAMEALVAEQERYFDQNQYILPQIVHQVITPDTQQIFELFRLNPGRLLSLCEKEAAHRQRRRYIESIDGIHVFGSDGGLSRSPSVHYMGSVDLFDESAQVFADSRINIGLQRIYAQDGLSDRIFNVTNAGGFLLSDRNDAILELFEEGREIACFYSREELADKVGYYLKNDDERERIARNGWLRTQRDHKLENRAEVILSLIKRHLA